MSATNFGTISEHIDRGTFQSIAKTFFCDSIHKTSSSSCGGNRTWLCVPKYGESLYLLSILLMLQVLVEITSVVSDSTAEALDNVLFVFLEEYRRSSLWPLFLHQFRIELMDDLHIQIP